MLKYTWEKDALKFAFRELFNLKKTERLTMIIINYFSISWEKWAEIVKQYFNEPNIGNRSRVLSILIIPNPHSYLTPCTQVTVHRSLYMCTVRYSPSLQAGIRPVPVSWAGVRVSCFHEPGEVSDGLVTLCWDDVWHVAIAKTWDTSQDPWHAHMWRHMSA